MTETENKGKAILANGLHVAVRYLLHAQDIKFLLCNENTEAVEAQRHAVRLKQKSEVLITEERLLKIESMMDDKFSSGKVRDLLVKVEHELLKLEKELRSKQAQGAIACHEEDVLLWVQKTVTVVLFLLGVSQIEVILSRISRTSKEKLHECFGAAFGYFVKARENCNTLFAYTQVLLIRDEGYLLGNGWNASDLVSH